MKRRFTPGMAAAVVIAFFTFSAAAVVSRVVFERLPHLEDEFGYLYQAKIFAGGQAYVLRDEPVKVFWQPFVLQPETSPDGLQKRFGKYTPGWPLLLSIGVALGQPWVINAFLAMLSVALVYRLAREIFGEPVGVVSALLLAISPMALLLNATLMSHISAMFMTIVFVYAYWRLTKNGKRRYLWAMVSGLALGWVITTRPLTALAMAAPVALHAVSRLIDALSTLRAKNQPDVAVSTEIAPTPLRAAIGVPVSLHGVSALFKSISRRSIQNKFGATLAPLVVLAVFMLPIAGLWPLFNQIWTGNWKTDTYTMLWSYDIVGFGPGHGTMAGGHTLEYGWRNARTDLAVWLRDLFGFTLDPTITKYAESNLGWGAGVGLSGFVVLLGLIKGRRSDWIWLFFEIFVAIVIAQMTYWIGSVVYGGAAYSLRYYYESTFAVCIVAGYGVVAWHRSWKKEPEVSPQESYVGTTGVDPHVMAGAVPVDYLNGFSSGRTPLQPEDLAAGLKAAWDKLWPGYILVFLACMISLLGYTPARFKEPLPGWPGGLFRYNKVGQDQLQAVSDMRARSGHPDQHVLIVILRNPNPSIEDNWRDYGAAMAVTSPYLDSDIVVARVFEPQDAPDIIQRFPGRLVLYQIGEDLYFTPEEAAAGATTRNKVDNSTVQ